MHLQPNVSIEFPYWYGLIYHGGVWTHLARMLHASNCPLHTSSRNASMLLLLLLFVVPQLKVNENCQNKTKEF